MSSKDDAQELDEQAMKLDIFSEEFEAVTGGVGGDGSTGGNDEDDEDEGGTTVLGPRAWQALFILNRELNKKK